MLPARDATSKIKLTLNFGTDLLDVLMSSISNANVFTYSDVGVLIPLNKYYANSSEYLVPKAEELLENGGIDVLKYIKL